MSGNRTNSYETHEETVTDYPVLCIIMRFMLVIHTANITPFIPTIRAVNTIDNYPELSDMAKFLILLSCTPLCTSLFVVRMIKSLK